MSGRAGAAFRNRTGPLGRARMKSANTEESPTGYRSRGPSAERQARRLARIGPALRVRAAIDDREKRAQAERRQAIRQQRGVKVTPNEKP